MKQYRDSTDDERREIEKNLSNEERKAIEVFNKPVETVIYKISSSGQRSELESMGAIEKIKSDKVATARTTSHQQSRRRRQKDSRNEIIVENWEKSKVNNLIENDSEESLALHEKLDEEKEDETANSTNNISTASVGETGSDSYACVVEENSLLGSTTFRWEHQIHWDWRLTNDGGRVSNTRNEHTPLHTTYFMSYDGKIDEWEKIDIHGRSTNDGVHQERYISYLQGHMEQVVPVLGVSAYDGYPYAELLGRVGTHSDYAWVRESGIET